MSTTKGKKLLIVDDEPDITFTIKNILEYNGFKVYSFTDSISACYLIYSFIEGYDFLV